MNVESVRCVRKLYNKLISDNSVYPKVDLDGSAYHSDSNTYVDKAIAIVSVAFGIDSSELQNDFLDYCSDETNQWYDAILN